MSNNQLKNIVERIENLETVKREAAEDIREIYAEAKGDGYDPAALRQIIKERREDAAKRAEREDIVETYKHQLEMPV